MPVGCLLSGGHARVIDSLLHGVGRRSLLFAHRTLRILYMLCHRLRRRLRRNPLRHCRLLQHLHHSVQDSQLPPIMPPLLGWQSINFPLCILINPFEVFTNAAANHNYRQNYETEKAHPKSNIFKHFAAFHAENWAYSVLLGWEVSSRRPCQSD